MSKILNSLASWGSPGKYEPTPLTGMAPSQLPQFASMRDLGLSNITPEKSGLDWLFNTKEGLGAASLGMGAANSLLNGYFGMKQYGLAKQQLAEGKRQFDLNFASQRNLTNSQLADRQHARVAANPGAYQSVSDYMSQYGIKG